MAVWFTSYAATRKYRKKGLLILNSETLKYEAGNEAKCDRLNLLAVLEAIREPSEQMLGAAGFAHTDETENIDWAGCARIQWRKMIGVLISEVRKAGNDA